MAIIEVTPDFRSPTTTQRLLALIYDRPQGSTIGQLAASLNRPVSMIQICLKDPSVSRYIVAKMRDDGNTLTRVYLPKPSPSPQQSIETISTFVSPTLDPQFLRQRVGLSRQAIATALSVSQRQIENWEKGKSYPKLSPAQLQRMLGVYECTLDELVAAFSRLDNDLN